MDPLKLSERRGRLRKRQIKHAQPSRIYSGLNNDDDDDDGDDDDDDDNDDDDDDDILANNSDPG